MILHLHIGGQVIRTTPEHPFYVQDQGWTRAGELEIGDLLATHGGRWLKVEDVLNTGEVETVYNMRVADFHTYFVGNESWGFDVWAHNTYNGGRSAAAQQAIDAFRTRNGLPLFDQAISATGTVARTRVKGQSFFAAQGGLTKGEWGQATYAVTRRHHWLNRLKEAGLIDSDLTLSHLNSLSHAEAMSLMKAADALGERGLGKRLTVNVDRITCDFCQGDGGLSALKKLFGLEELNVVDSFGGRYNVQ